MTAHDSPDLVDRLTTSTIGALEMFSIYLGTELGLYEALDRHGPLTATSLAETAGINERYAHEWLEQQAVAGFIAVASDGDATTRAYALPAEHRGALIDPVDESHLAPFSGLIAGIGSVLDQVVEAYRTGDGVPFADYGKALRHGQGGINRPAFSTDLVKAWLPATTGVTERLGVGGRVIDLATGVGWSAIAVQAAWPSAEVIGVDIDEASIIDARANAKESGVDVRFELVDEDGDDLAQFGPADVVLILEALHDMSRPVEVLAKARAALAPGGTVVVADEAVAETFAAPGDELERLMYGWSVTHCLPASMETQPSAALGTALRPAEVARLAAEAGFANCDVVDVDAGFFRIYQLTVTS